MASNSNNQSWALRPWGTPEWLRQRPANPPISALIRCLRRWGFPFPKARGGADQYGALAGWSVVVQVVLWGWTGRRRRRTTRGRRRGRAALRGCGESQEQSRLGLSDRRQNLDCKTWQWRSEAARDLSKAGQESSSSDPPTLASGLSSRLLSIDFPDTCDLSSGMLCQGWTIDTKYYSADLSIWTAHLDDGFSFRALPNFKQLAALVMVFDMSDGSSFLALQNWVAKIDIKSFEILLCIGNKADLVPGHYAHREYRRRMQKHGESTSDPHPEYLDYGIDETEGCSLLEDEEPSLDIRKSCLEWCCQNNIEYIEACFSNADFDKCLSVDGDIQGVERLYGALSAHMWPGMILKSGNRITIPSLVDKAETTDDESDYDFEYEVLSHGSDEPWDNTGDLGVTSKKGFVSEVNQFVKDGMVDGSGSRVDISTSSIAVGASSVSPSDLASESVVEDRPDTENKTNEYQDQKDKRETSADQAPASEVERQVELEVNAANNILDEDALYGLDDLERLMSEIGNMRENLRLMPDFQRREMAAKLAMKMAAMFGDSGDEDGL